MNMHPERIEGILDELHRNPHQSYESIIQNVVDSKNVHSAERGDTSEAMAKLLIHTVPELVSVRDCHFRVDGLDADLQADFINMELVNIQVKSNDYAQEYFLDKIKEREKRLGRKVRFVVISTEKPFSEIVCDFVNQINTLEGHRVLKMP